LIRDLRELAELNADRPAVLAWVEAVIALYRRAQAFADGRPRRRAQAQRGFQQALARLAGAYAKEAEAPQCTLAQRMMKHLSELFVFVGDPAVPADNNLAERSLRPAVVARKISGGTRSAKGSETRMGLMSLFGTWQAQGKPLLPTCQELLLSPSPA